MQIKIEVKQEYKYTSPSIRPLEIMEYFPLHININDSIFKTTESFKDSAKSPPPADRIYI